MIRGRRLTETEEASFDIPVSFLTSPTPLILPKRMKKIIPNIAVGTARVINEPLQPQTPAIAAAIIGAKKKLTLPPITWKPRARPRFAGSTDDEISGAEAG